jgi:phospholipase A1
MFKQLWLIASIFIFSNSLYAQDHLVLDVPVVTQSNEENIEGSTEDSIKTEVKTFDIIAEEEFSESMHQYPGLIEKIQTERLAANNPYVLLPHKPNYFMPFTYQSKINQDEQEQFFGGRIAEQDSEYGNADFEHYEFVFQLSVKYIVAENILGKFSTLAVAYTNKSFWQSYNKSVSAIFRETNHEPEIILGFKPSVKWSDHMTLAFNHQSNGQVGNLSRSWNRIIMSTAKIWPNRILNVRAWYRMPETAKADPNDPSDNDNPDIDDFLGYGDVFYLRKFGEHSLAATVRNNFNFDENKGAIELDWTFPLPGNLKGFVQYFNGYGESLIDYNQYQERIGIGIKIADWL